jgi:hypothetical protein
MRVLKLHIPSVLFFTFTLTLFFSIESFGEEIIVKLKADSLKYDDVSGVVFASGSVEARLKGFTINSSTLTYDKNSNVVTAEGDVLISSADYHADCASISYDASTEVGLASKFYTVLAPSDIKGSVFLRVDEFYEKPGFKWGKESDVTTCDQSEPHYDIRAKRFDYYPDDKIVAYFATFYINKVPVMWFPVWVYSFKKKRSSLMPVIGHNEVEGDFAKFGFDYFVSNNANGIIFVDLMRKKGLGKGVLHDYTIDEKNSGSLYLYHVEERDSGLTDWVTKLDHRLKLSGDTTMNFTQKYSDIYLVPLGRLDQTYYKVELNHLSDRKFNTAIDVLDDRWGMTEGANYKLSHSLNGYNTDFSSSFSKAKYVPSWSKLSQRLTHSQPLLKDNMTFSTVMNFYRNAPDEKGPFDERFEPQVELVDREDEFSIRAFQNWYIDLDRDLYTGDDNTEYLERQPELTLSLKPRDLSLFTLNTDFSAARFHETKWISNTSRLRNYTTERYNANFRGTRTLAMPLYSSLSLMAAVEQYLYAPGDQRYVFREGIGLSTALGGFFINSIDYQRGRSEGNTPFFFDIIGVDHEFISDTVTLYYLDKVRWISNCGYNYRTELYNDLTSRLIFTPDYRISSQVSTGYDPNNQIWRDLTFSLGLRPLPKISWDWNSVHDINNNLFKSASSILDVEIGDDWRYKFHVKVGHAYDYFTGRFIMRDLMVVKDLHCWEMKFVYSDWRREWRLSFTLIAFPDQPVGWGAGENGYFFEGFSEDTLTKGFNQPSPSRY